MWKIKTDSTDQAMNKNIHTVKGTTSPPKTWESRNRREAGRNQQKGEEWPRYQRDKKNRQLMIIITNCWEGSFGRAAIPHS